MSSIIAIIAVVAYALGLTLIIPSLLRRHSIYPKVAFIAILVALLCHAYTLYLRIFDVSIGQNLSLINISSAVSLLIAIVMTLVAINQRGHLLLPIVYTFTLLNVAANGFLPNEFITNLEASPSLLLHIGLALFSYATLIIAALYAGQLAYIDHALKHKSVTFYTDMPPLMSIERKMFHITSIGFILLTLTLISGSVALNNIFSDENLHKSVLAIIAWFVYLVLLYGRFHSGWRGRRVVLFNVSGATILTIAYFGSRLVQHIGY